MSLNTDATVLDSLAATSLRATVLCLLDDISTGNASLLDKIHQKDAEIEQLVEKANNLEILWRDHEKSKIPFSYMLYAYSVKRAYRGTKPKESFR